MMAAKGGHPGATRLLLTAGADADLRNEDGATAMAWAASAGHEDVVKLIQGAPFR
jgi:ankyrin repeat protein